LSASANDKTRFDVVVRPQVRHWSDWYIKDVQNDFGTLFPLLRRAWAYQERLLAPRVLHFGKEELVWNCMERQFYCQCGNLRPTPSFVATLAAARTILATQIHDDVRLDDRDTESKWHRVVEDYSECDLTFEMDRLPALAGLAEQAHRFRRGRYLAGLWEDSLISDLCWTRSSSRNAKSTESSSPTWSWSSLARQVRFHWALQPLQPLCEILEIVYKPASVFNPRGQVSHGKLVIRGHIIDVTLKDGNIDLPGINRRCDLDYDISLSGPGHVEEGSTLLCLTVGTRSRTAYSLVMRCIDEKTQVYERIGLICCVTDERELFTNLLLEWRSSQETSEADAKDLYDLRIRSNGDLDFLMHRTNPSNVVQLHPRQTESYMHSTTHG